MDSSLGLVVALRLQDHLVQNLSLHLVLLMQQRLRLPDHMVGLETDEGGVKGQAGRQTDRRADRETTDTLTDTWTDRQTDRDTWTNTVGWQRERETHGQTGRHMD